MTTKNPLAFVEKIDKSHLVIAHFPDGEVLRLTRGYARRKQADNAAKIVSRKLAEMMDELDADRMLDDIQIELMSAFENPSIAFTDRGPGWNVRFRYEARNGNQGIAFGSGRTRVEAAASLQCTVAGPVRDRTKGVGQ